MDIFKLLPKTNCRDCQSPSCLAFAMKVAAGKGDFRLCPHLSDESEAKLAELMEPPQVTVELTRGPFKIKLGGEKVIFRHDESFYSPPPVFAAVESHLSENELSEKLQKIQNLRFERVGQILQVEGVALKDSGNGDFAGYFESVLSRWPMFVAVESHNENTVKEIMNRPDTSGIILLTSPEIIENNRELVKSFNGAVSAMARSIEEAGQIGGLFRKASIKKAVVSVESTPSPKALNILYNARIRALSGKDRNFGYPVMAWHTDTSSVYDAAGAVMKYASAVAVNCDDPALILPLLTLRQNIFTDPRRPIQVEARLYEFGDVTPGSPVFVTTNFSLTYFTVSSEIESARVPSYLVIVDTDGTSVLTAWSADRFNRKTILNALDKTGVFEKVNHRRLIIPGYVSMMKEELEEDTNLTIITGPREASGIPDFLRRRQPLESVETP